MFSRSLTLFRIHKFSSPLVLDTMTICIPGGTFFPVLYELAAINLETGDVDLQQDVDPSQGLSGARVRGNWHACGDLGKL